MGAFSKRIAGIHHRANNPRRITDPLVILCKTSKKTPPRTAVSRILTAVPIWEGCASKKALRGVIIGLLRILLHPLYVFRGIEKNETRYEITSAKGNPSRLFQGYPHPLPTYSCPEDTRSLKERERGESWGSRTFPFSSSLIFHPDMLSLSIPSRLPSHVSRNQPLSRSRVASLSLSPSLPRGAASQSI